MNTVFDDFKNAWQRPNNAVAQLIIINVIVFVGLFVISLLRFVGLEQVSIFIQKQFIIPSDVSEFLFRPWTAITYAFNHGGIMHILFNMLALYWFGKVFTDFLGSQKLINLYVIGALAGALAFLFLYTLIPSLGYGMMVGASGAIIAIVIATATFLPDYRFYLLFFGPVKIIYIAIFYIFISLYGLLSGDNVGGNLAHLAGALVGFVYAKQLQKGNELGTWVFKFMTFIKNLSKPRPKIKVTHRNKTKSTKTTKKSGKSNVSQDEIDTILDKISEKGYESLTKEEKEKLFNASKK